MRLADRFWNGDPRLHPECVMVMAKDYDALAAENQRLETELAELKAEEPEWSAQMQRLGDDNQRLQEALTTAEQYLSRNQMNLICSGSILHRQMQAALATANGEVA
jgi:cell division septum initiation protein DivIVA